MGEVVVRGVAHVCKINGWPAVAASGINHFTKGGILVVFSARLDNEIGKPPVEDRIECVDMNLVKAELRLSVWLEESIRIVRIAENINCGPVAGNELVFTVVKLV